MPNETRRSDDERALRIVVASRNPVKIEATRGGFRRAFPGIDPDVRGLSVPSGVSDQPFSDAETLRGARQRAEGARAAEPDADFWVGLEGGIEEHDGELFAGAWVFILGATGHGRSRTANFLLPPAVAERVRSGTELGSAMDQLFDRRGSKKGPGAVGLLTDEALGRTELYEPAVVLALAPLRKRSLYVP